MRAVLAAAFLLVAGPVAAAAQGKLTLPRAAQPLRTSAPIAFANPALSESSALAPSRRQRGVLWTLNDSGNPPDLFATDTLGHDLARFRVAGAKNTDWEELALGPCPRGGDCLYIADTGDNGERRKKVSLYRIPEPTVPRRSNALLGTAPAERVEFTYPGGPRDVEAMYVDAAGDTWLLTKGRGGRIGQLYVVRASQWAATGVGLATHVQNLPLPQGRGIEKEVTAAALSPDARRVAVRTYGDLFLFARRLDGTLEPSTVVRCAITGLQPQGEGIAWLQGDLFGLSSEQKYHVPASVALVRCPLPPLP